MTSAKLAQLRLRREQEFLEACVGLEERLEEAKAAYVAARDSGDQSALAEARAELKAASEEMFAFRSWARTMGQPRQGVPGRDATIQIGGAVE
ncbi:hypothetical protein ACFXJ8_25975 [Nonomuraea sp. NPDC059194]|uniref:hypothetical protein n=1 Tax=Nonomuraea sp. NPDC059194 TaxID=3346764 RepID=UPI0036D07402